VWDVKAGRIKNTAKKRITESLKDNLLALLSHIWQSRRIPKDWEVGLVINVHKKGNANNCGNYRGVTLLSTASKLYANILRNKLNKYTEEILGEEQCGSRTGRGWVDAIFTINQILQKRREQNLSTYLLFIDYEKAYDKLNRDRL
jgi:hypothetical protein